MYIKKNEWATRRKLGVKQIIIHSKFDCLFLHRYRSFCEETAIPWDWPVEVNYHEAKAYAAWKGPDYRLPTESEHNAMRDQQVLLHCLS